MAKNPRKVQDPTQAALSAIEEALQTGGDTPTEAAPDKSVASDDPRRSVRDSVPAATVSASGPFIDEPPSIRRRLPAGRRAHAPANDDRQSVGQILGALHARPPRTPLYVAAIASAWWVVMALVIGYSRTYQDISQTSGLLDLVDLPYFWLFFATLVLPPVLFFTIAAMIRRAQEMRLVSRAMTEVTLRLAEPEGVSTDAVVSFSQAIRREVAALGDGIERAIARASELETMVRNEVATLERAYDENELRVRALVDELQSERDAIVSHGTRLREAIGGAHESFSFDVEGAATRIETTLTESTARINASLIESTDRINISLTESSDRINASLTESNKRVTDGFLKDIEGVATRIETTLTEVNGLINASLAESSSRIAEASDRINASLAESSTRITDGFLTQAETASAQISEASDKVLEAFTSRGTELEQRLSRIGIENAERLGQVGIETANALDSRTALLTESINNSMEKLVDTITSKGDEVHDTITARIAETEEVIGRHGHEVADRIASETSALSLRVTESVQSFESAVKMHGPALAEQVSQAVNFLSDQARDALSSLDERTSGKLRETTEAIDSRIQRIEQTIDSRTQSLNETLAGRTLELARTITDGSKVAAEAVDKTVAGMGEYFAGKAQEIAVTISDRAEAVDQTLGKRALELTQNLDSHIQHFEAQVSHKLVGITETIESRGITLTDSLVAKLDEASNALVSRMGTVSKNLRDEASEMEHTLTQLGDQMTKTLVERTGETVKGFAEQTQQIAATHEALRENVVGSLDKLLESNRLFKQLLQGVTESLEPLENAMAKRVTAFQGALENTVGTTRSSVDWIDNQMNELRNISGSVLRDLAAVTQRFEGQGRYIASVAETLSETHGRIDQSLEERREAIEHIIALLVDRTAAIEENFGDRSQQIGERLAAFNRMLHESLAAAETRAQDIARHIIDSTNQISQTINKQHEVIRAGYSEERGRTATALKTTYEEAMDEMKQMFTDLQERFTDTAREVRDVASEVQASLDQTRVELKRGVLELPHETRESADAMRRVVADQLKALSELNDIVSRHAREMEAIEPTRGYREEAVAAGGARYSEAASATEIPSARQRATAPRGEPIEFRRPRTEPARKAAGPRAVSHTRDDGQRGGWLTDLVTNTDEARDDDTQDTVDSLDSLSLDIARMIDHDAAVELWDRHKRGERGVFTRRLYTPQGQKTFDEIRRRYRKSNDFRETVDRYIDEFERLLEQVGRDDRGQVLSKTYLTSDTGKVYTLLAHAAARLN
jgi:hypothetical protein